MDERSRLIKRNNPHLINNRIQWFPIILLAVWRASHVRLAQTIRTAYGVGQQLMISTFTGSIFWLYIHLVSRTIDLERFERPLLRQRGVRSMDLN